MAHSDDPALPGAGSNHRNHPPGVLDGADLVSELRHVPPGQAAPPRVWELIRAGTLINRPGIAADQPLYWAIEKRLSDVALELIRRGANVNACVGRVGGGYLGKAISYHMGQVALELVRRGANVNPPGSSLGTPLLWATQDRNMADVALELVRRGADVNRLGGLVDQPLYWALRHRMTDVVHELVRRGALVSLRNQRPGDVAALLDEMATSPDASVSALVDGTLYQEWARYGAVYGNLTRRLDFWDETRPDNPLRAKLRQRHEAHNKVVQAIKTAPSPMAKRHHALVMNDLVHTPPLAPLTRSASLFHREGGAGYQSARDEYERTQATWPPAHRRHQSDES